MNRLKKIVGALGIAVPLALGAGSAHAEDTLKVVIGQINNWENQAPTLGQDAGIFKKHGLVLENTGTQGAGETIQAVISGSADIGAGVGVAGVMRAFSKGAPVRILAPMFTGTGDIYWYVKADSKIQSLKDATADNTIAYSTSGSSSNNVVVAFVSELGAKAKPTATGGPPGTLTAVMSGQVDIGWSAPPFGLQEIKEGKIRIVARGSDVRFGGALGLDVHGPRARVERRGLEGHGVRARIDRAIDLLAVPRHDAGHVVALLRRRTPLAVPSADQRMPFLREKRGPAKAGRHD